MSPEGKHNTDIWKVIGVTLLVGAVLALAGESENGEVQDYPRPIQATLYPTSLPQPPAFEPVIIGAPVPPAEVNCHGKVVGENAVFMTDDGNIGQGIVYPDPNGGASVTFRNGLNYSCNRLALHN